MIAAGFFAFLLAGGLIAYNGAAKRDEERRAPHPAPAWQAKHEGHGPHPPLVKQVISDAIFFASHLAA